MATKTKSKRQEKKKSKRAKKLSYLMTGMGQATDVSTITQSDTFCADKDLKRIELPEVVIDTSPKLITCVNTKSTFHYRGKQGVTHSDKPVTALTYIIPAANGNPAKAVHFIDVGYYQQRQWSDIELAWFYYQEFGMLILPVKIEHVLPKMEVVSAGASIADALAKYGEIITPKGKNKLSVFKQSGNVAEPNDVYKLAVDDSGNLLPDSVSETGAVDGEQPKPTHKNAILARRFVFPMWHVHVPKCEKGRNVHTVAFEFNPLYRPHMYKNTYDQWKYEARVNETYNAVVSSLKGDVARIYEQWISKIGFAGVKKTIRAGVETPSMLLLNRRYMVWITDVEKVKRPTSPMSQNLAFDWKDGVQYMRGATERKLQICTDLDPEAYIQQFVLPRLGLSIEQYQFQNNG